jgi:hypothetical protein
MMADILTLEISNDDTRYLPFGVTLACSKRAADLALDDRI